jgi:hypothetical protein
MVVDYNYDLSQNPKSGQSGGNLNLSIDKSEENHQLSSSDSVPVFTYKLI